MKQYYEAKVRYDKIDETTGKEKSVTEPYLIDAISFTEAETRIHEEMSEYISGDFDVVSIKRDNISEIIAIDGKGQWYRCRIKLIDINEAGREKQIDQYALVYAETTEEATRAVKDKYKDVIVPWRIASVSETAIIDVFDYEQPTEKE